MPQLTDYLTESAQQLLVSQGPTLVKQIGLDVVRSVVTDVLLGKNIRSSTEMLTRKRIGLINLSLVNFFVQAQSQGYSINSLLDAAATNLKNPSKGQKKAERWLNQWLLGLGHPALYGLLLVALLLFGLAWQVGFSYKIAQDSQWNLDEPFVKNFNSVELTPKDQPEPFFYRWSKGEGRVLFPGIGKHAYSVKLKLAGSANPAPDYKLYANQTLITSGRLEPGLKEYVFEIPAEAIAGKNGDLEIRVEMPVFQPKGDSRELGFVFVGAEVQASGNGATLPPPLQLGYLLGVVGLVYLICGRAGFGGWSAGGVAGFFAAVLAYVIATPGARIWLTIFSQQLVFAFGLALFFIVLADIPMRRVWGEKRGERAWVLAIFGLGLALKLAGLLHPQIRVIDIGFHLNNFIALWQNAEWFRKIQSAEWGGNYTYYPPTTYVFAGLFQWLFTDKILLLKIWMVVAESSRALLIYYLVKRATGDGRAGVISAFLMAVLPVGVISVSFGQVANLFGEWLMLATLCLIIGKFEKLNRPPYFIALTLLMLANFVQHPGVILLSGTAFLLIIIFMRFSSAGRRGWMPLLLAFGLAIGLSFALYHWKTTQEMIPQFLNRGSSTAPVKCGGPGWRVGGSLDDRRLGLIVPCERVQTVPALLIEGSKGFLREAQVYFALFPAVFALFGFSWLWSASRIRKNSIIDQKEREARRRLFWIMAAWLLTGLFFALVGLTLNLYVRYSLFLLPFVAICAGLFLAHIWRRTNWAGMGLTLAIGAYLLITTLAMYYDRIIYYGHGGAG